MVKNKDRGCFVAKKNLEKEWTRVYYCFEYICAVYLMFKANKIFWKWSWIVY